MFKGYGPTLRGLPFEKTCKGSCHGRLLVTDNVKDSYTIFQIMSFEDIIKLIEHNTELRCGIDLTEAQGRNQNARFLIISQRFVAWSANLFRLI